MKERGGGRKREGEKGVEGGGCVNKSKEKNERT
jgi:hypothetical protein